MDWIKLTPETMPEEDTPVIVCGKYLDKPRLVTSDIWYLGKPPYPYSEKSSYSFFYREECDYTYFADKNGVCPYGEYLDIITHWAKYPALPDDLLEDGGK